MASRNAAAAASTTKKSVASVPGPPKTVQNTASKSKKVVPPQKSGPSKNVTPGQSLTSNTGSNNRSQNIKGHARMAQLGRTPGMGSTKMPNQTSQTRPQPVPQPAPKVKPPPPEPQPQLQPKTKIPDRSRVGSKFKVEPGGRAKQSTTFTTQPRRVTLPRPTFKTSATIISELLKGDAPTKVKVNDKPWRHGMKAKESGKSLPKEMSGKEISKATSKKSVPSHKANPVSGKNEAPVVETLIPPRVETPEIQLQVLKEPDPLEIWVAGPRQANEVNTEQAPSGMEIELHEAGFRENDEAKTPNKLTSPLKIGYESSLPVSPAESSRELSGILSDDSVAAMKWVAKPPPTSSITHPAVLDIIQGKDISVVFKQFPNMVLDSEVELGLDHLKPPSQHVLSPVASGNKVNLERGGRRISDIGRLSQRPPTTNLPFRSEGELTLVGRTRIVENQLIKVGACPRTTDPRGRPMFQLVGNPEDEISDEGGTLSGTTSSNSSRISTFAETSDTSFPIRVEDLGPVTVTSEDPDESPRRARIPGVDRSNDATIDVYGPGRDWECDVEDYDDHDAFMPPLSTDHSRYTIESDVELQELLNADYHDVVINRSEVTTLRAPLPEAVTEPSEFNITSDNPKYEELMMNEDVTPHLRVRIRSNAHMLPRTSKFIPQEEGTESKKLKDILPNTELPADMCGLDIPEISLHDRVKLLTAKGQTLQHDVWKTKDGKLPKFANQSEGPTDSAPKEPVAGTSVSMQPKYPNQLGPPTDGAQKEPMAGTSTSARAKHGNQSGTQADGARKEPVAGTSTSARAKYGNQFGTQADGARKEPVAGTSTSTRHGNQSGSHPTDIAGKNPVAGTSTSTRRNILQSGCLPHKQPDMTIGGPLSPSRETLRLLQDKVTYFNPAKPPLAGIKTTKARNPNQYYDIGELPYAMVDPKSTSESDNDHGRRRKPRLDPDPDTFYTYNDTTSEALKEKLRRNEELRKEMQKLIHGPSWPKENWKPPYPSNGVSKYPKNPDPYRHTMKQIAEGKLSRPRQPLDLRLATPHPSRVWDSNLRRDGTFVDKKGIPKKGTYRKSQYRIQPKEPKPDTDPFIEQLVKPRMKEMVKNEMKASKIPIGKPPPVPKPTFPVKPSRGRNKPGSSKKPQHKPLKRIGTPTRTGTTTSGVATAMTPPPPRQFPDPAVEILPIRKVFEPSQSDDKNDHYLPKHRGSPYYPLDKKNLKKSTPIVKPKPKRESNQNYIPEQTPICDSCETPILKYSSEDAEYIGNLNVQISETRDRIQDLKSEYEDRQMDLVEINEVIETEERELDEREGNLNKLLEVFEARKDDVKDIEEDVKWLIQKKMREQRKRNRRSWSEESLRPDLKAKIHEDILNHRQMNLRVTDLIARTKIQNLSWEPRVFAENIEDIFRKIHEMKEEHLVDARRQQSAPDIITMVPDGEHTQGTPQGSIEQTCAQEDAIRQEMAQRELIGQDDPVVRNESFRQELMQQEADRQRAPQEVEVIRDQLRSPVQWDDVDDEEFERLADAATLRRTHSKSFQKITRKR